MTSRPLTTLGALSLLISAHGLVGCGDSDADNGSSGSGASGSGASGSGASGSGGGGTGANGSGGGGTGASGTGGGANCENELTVVQVSTSITGTAPVFATAAANGDTVISWASAGQVRVARADAAGALVGSEVATPGDHVHGLAMNGDNYGLLVANGADELHLVELDAAGNTTVDTMLTGNSDHDVVGSEWYAYSQNFAADGGRLLFSGTQYIAYFQIFRRWPDLIAHTGDTLRFLDPSGNPEGGGWDWGCSHSLDVRLALSGNDLAPVCLSDCFAQKAILFADSKQISAEPSGNCGGSSSAALGGLVAMGGNFWLTYISLEGRSSKDVGLAKLAIDGTLEETIWLTDDAVDDSGAHLTAFEDGLLAAWKSGGAHYIAKLDASGAMVGAPFEVTTSFRDKDDFWSYPNGDTGWIIEDGGSYSVYRYSACN